jgi:hypothetical protein
VHLHIVLMLAAVVLVWLFVGIVVAVTWLLRRGRLGEPSREVPFRAYGPILAAACSGGAAAVHLEVVGEHALQTGSAASGSAYALICSIGAGSAHFSAADTSIAGFLPLGIASLVIIGLQAVLAIPRAWRNPMLAVGGLVVSGISVLIALVPKLTNVASAPGVTTVATVGYADALAVVLEIALAIVVGLLVLGRPRGLLDRLQVKVADAYVGTGLGVAAVLVFTVASVFAGHAVH